MVLSSPDVIKEVVELIVQNIHIDAESSTCGQVSSIFNPPQALLKPEVMNLVRLKRSLRRRYMKSQDPVDKSAYRRAEDDLKKLYETKRKYFVEMLPTKPYGFNLRKPQTGSLTRPNTP